jgi:hypothetical protein
MNTQIEQIIEIEKSFSMIDSQVQSDIFFHNDNIFSTLEVEKLSLNLQQAIYEYKKYVIDINKPMQDEFFKGF